MKTSAQCLICIKYLFIKRGRVSISIAFLGLDVLWLTPVILATQKARILAQGQPKQKANENTSLPKSWAWWHLPVISAT
jgi:hypothetical protein